MRNVQKLVDNNHHQSPHVVVIPATLIRVFIPIIILLALRLPKIVVTSSNAILPVLLSVLRMMRVPAGLTLLRAARIRAVLVVVVVRVVIVAMLAVGAVSMLTVWSVSVLM
jgi:hypothetical protein